MGKLIAATITWLLVSLVAMFWNMISFLLIFALIYADDANHVPGFPDPSGSMVSALDVARVAGSGITFIIWAFGAGLLLAIPFGLGKLFGWYGRPTR